MKFAPVKFAPRRYAPVKFAPARFAPRRYATARFAPAKSAPARFAPARFAPAKSAPGRSTPLKSRSPLAYRSNSSAVLVVQPRAFAFNGTSDSTCSQRSPGMNCPPSGPLERRRVGTSRECRTTERRGSISRGQHPPRELASDSPHRLVSALRPDRGTAAATRPPCFTARGDAGS